MIGMTTDEMLVSLGIKPTLEQAKEQKKAELKQARDKAEQLPITTNKGTFDVDDKSLQRINGAIMTLAGTGLTIGWTLADNTIVEVNEYDLRSVIVALAGQSNDVHVRYRQLKEQVLSCETIEQVMAVEW